MNWYQSSQLQWCKENQYLLKGPRGFNAEHGTNRWAEGKINLFHCYSQTKFGIWGEAYTGLSFPTQGKDPSIS